MRASVSGTLVSLDLLPRLAARGDARASHVSRVLRDAFARLGPASGARQVFDLLALPLCTALGFEVRILNDTPCGMGAVIASGHDAALVGVGEWGADLLRLRGQTATPRSPLRWWIGLNGPRLRIIDLTRVHARRVLDVDLERLVGDQAGCAAVGALLGAGKNTGFASLDEIVEASDRHRTRVSRSLQSGVDQALAHLVIGLANGSRRAAALDGAFSDALTIVYRILFLLFAEARGLVPRWHPIYRDSYTIESLVDPGLFLRSGAPSPSTNFRGSANFRVNAAATPSLERTRAFRRQGEPHTGLWESLQAIWRLAHRGCRAGTLRVTPFNGRLFAPASAPLADTFALDDRVIRDVLVAIATRPDGDRRARITYADLGVEHLGAVYERVLDFAPVRRNGSLVLESTGRRKATGTFYTPRSMTEYLVRRTLAPLVRGRSPDQVLALRVLDPAMGSGAFLVAACRYLADAYERALVGDGSLAARDVGAAERAIFRRTIARHCLYGVDLNPTAVQLARLSLWLCTLAADRPLTFFDHHLRSGNSIVGAAPADIFRQPPTRRRARLATLPLFEVDDLPGSLASAIAPRLAIAAQADDTAAIVRAKERTLATLDGPAGPLATWRRLADAWCASWFWPDDAAPPWPALSACVRGASAGLPAALERDWRRTVEGVCSRERFFHWELEFPEIFFESDGAPRLGAGFDAVIGNPPWDTLRGDPGAQRVTRFTRASGCYRLQSDGHANLYQLFAERMLRLVRAGGRIGMVMPSGLIADHGCTSLRHALFERCSVDALLGFDNREGIFPIHRGVRFVLLAATAYEPSNRIGARFGLHTAITLDDIPDEGSIPGGTVLPRTLIERWSGASLAIPELTAPRDREVLARVVDTIPPLGDAAGWNAHFGRELNATDDRGAFGASGLPVLEGKLIEPFEVHVDRAAAHIDARAAARILGSRAAFTRPRLGYREVAASTNRLTLIAAMIPAGTVTTHSVFVLKTPLDDAAQWFLCGIFNSFVANYLVRLRGGTHVTAAAMELLRVPRPVRDDVFLDVAALARALTRDPRDTGSYVTLQVRVAALYGLAADEFAHVLGTFPLIDPSLRARCRAAYEML